MKNRNIQKLPSIQFNVPGEVLQILRDLAGKEGRSLGNFVRYCVVEPFAKSKVPCNSVTVPDILRESPRECRNVVEENVVEIAPPVYPSRLPRVTEIKVGEPVLTACPPPAPSASQDAELVRKYGCKTWEELEDLWQQGMIAGPKPVRTSRV